MTIQNELGTLVKRRGDTRGPVVYQTVCSVMRLLWAKPAPGTLLALTLLAATANSGQAPFREQLSHSPFKVAFETYTNSNWEIFVMNADGSNPMNLTQTPKEQEHYPQVSPDSTKICF